jgi:hypothetical protein
LRQGQIVGDATGRPLDPAERNGVAETRNRDDGQNHDYRHHGKQLEQAEPGRAS